METTREIEEAINTANEAMDHLSKADEILGHAQNWGIVDLLGGGLITTLIKRSNMSNAQQEIEQAKELMNLLAGYLRDFAAMPNVHLPMNDFLGFADYFFDGLIADWVAQSRINDARQQVKDAMEEIQGIIDGLEELL